MAGRRGRGSIEFRNGKAYAKVTIGKSRTMRLLTLEDGRPCPADLVIAESCMPRLFAKIDAEAAMDNGERASLREWLDHEYAAILRSRLTRHAADQAESYVERFAAWAEEEIRPDVYMHEVTRADVEGFCADFLLGAVPAPLGREDRQPAKPRTYKPSYLRRFTNVLRRAWNDAQVRGFVRSNPWSKLRLPRIVQPDVPWVEPSSVEAICDAATPPTGQRLRFIAWTGLCVGETLALRREHLDLDRGALFVPHGKTPGRTRAVPLAPETVALLRAQPVRDDGLVFEPRTAESIRQRLKTACRHLHLPELTTHQLRHVYASHLAVSGSHPRDVAALLGHSDGGALALRRYARWFPPESEARSVERLRAFRATRGSDVASPGTPAPPPSPPDPGPSSDAKPRASRSPRRR